MFKTDTFKKLANILPCINKLYRFILCDLTEAFDFASMTDFLVKNENILISLNYGVLLSDAYKEIIEKFIAKIIETPPKRIPYIDFPGFENSFFYDDYRKLYEKI
uniref:Uncharacterized protein n=1 Tax=Panagrolaimus superbus TaxID=310955 RepID=A0A914Y4X4_9BILA